MPDTDVEAFSSYLRETGRDWLLVEQLDDQCVHLRFTGPFQGRTVIWDCEFATLDKRQSQRNYIDVETPQSSGISLRVGLSLARIDTAATKKMVLMIRHYKRLRSGRHEYGERFNHAG